ncbi:MAG: phosphoethanolamine--lipid A transferase [Gammaproteobacteria bacterium PRO9]|nr:phosphoethanolamine--lipid A transferase [Gammaproteobacteria bacterium PRO9]
MASRSWTVLTRRRPTLGVEALILLASLAFAALYNNALWKLLFGDADFRDLHTVLLFAALFGIVVLVQFSGLALLLTRRTARPVLAILFIATAFASYYMDRYTVFLNQEMLRNVLATDPAEAGELLTPTLFLHLLLYALLPVLVLVWVRVAPRTSGFGAWRRSVLVRLATVAGAMLLAAVLLFTQYQAELSLLRPHREARHLVTPTNYLAALYKLARNEASDPEGPRVPIGLDARRVVAPGQEKKPVLLVLVVGESVRSANFGLSGYARHTTPELRKLDVLVYPRVESCGTSTEVSVPCMFSPLGRRNYDADRVEHEQSLLNLLDRTGYPTVWIDNQSGCKGVCSGLPEVRIPGDADPALCNGERCLDGILESQLANVVKERKGDLVVVLHMLGNHGPAYWRRYPPAFRRFTPDCETLEVSECSSTEITNAYDNAILYTDHVLAGLIRFLGTLDGRDTALLYVSDHGESLGESGIYLHGLPRSIAPAVQHQVPMVAWLSPGFERSSRLDEQCLERGTSAELSHDNLFSSVLGLLQVDTKLRDPALDIFSRCRTLPASRAAQSPATGQPHDS